MNWKQVLLLSGALATGIAWAEEPAPPPNAGDAPAAGADEGHDNGGDKGKKEDKQENRAHERDNARGRGRRMGGMGGMGGMGMGGRMQMPMQPEQMKTMAARMAGVDLDDGKAEAQLDTLPFGTQRRFILDVPVGGVDNFTQGEKGWKVEQMYKLTFEQTNSLQALRDEYQTELKKLQDELTAQQKAMADKVKELRGKFELRANDVLTGEDKEHKQKIDAINSELNEKNAKMAVELFGNEKDMRALFGISRDLRQKASDVTETAEKQIADLVSPEGKALIEEHLKQQAEQRERMQRWMQGMGNRGRDGQGQPGNHGKEDAVKPPQPPPGPAGNF